MRPVGVRERIERLRDEQRRFGEAHPERAWQRAVTWFLHGCALLGYGDAGASSVVDAYRAVLAHEDDPQQQRGISAWHADALQSLAQLRSPLAPVAVDPQRHAARDEEIAAPALLRIPPTAFLGRATADAYFPLACLNAAGSLGEQAITPYEAATLVCGIGYYQPEPTIPMLARMRTLRTHYEDDPEQRPVLDEKISQELHTWETTYRATL